MQLTILGNYGCFPAAGGACSGYLLEHGETRVLLDCGNGVLSRLQRYCRIEQLDAIVLSHLHFDHTADLLILKYALESKRALGEPINRIPLYLPATPDERARLLADETVFAPAYLSDGNVVKIGALAFRFARMEHSIESYAMVIHAEGKQITYSGDTIATPRLAEAARGSDLFLCEAGVAPGEISRQRSGPHLTARQAAEIAAEARVGRLLLTHFWFEADKAMILSQAQTAFPSAVLAEEYIRYTV